MVFLATTIICAVVSWAAAPAIHKYPWVLYSLSAILSVALIFGAFSLIPGTAGRAVLILMRRGMLALALFTVVMFIGVIPRGSSLRVRMNSVRAELSIAACILIAGHIAVNMVVFLPRMINPNMRVSLTASLVIAFVLLVFLLVLGFTSIAAVKEHMDAHRWKFLQRLAYVFYGLVFAQIVFVLGPPALTSTSARVNLGIYTAVFVLYAIARTIRFMRDRARRQ